MLKFSKDYTSGNTVYKVAFPIVIFTRGEFFYEGKKAIFRGGGEFYYQKIA